MGKRKGGAITGLARYVFEAVDESNSRAIKSEIISASEGPAAETLDDHLDTQRNAEEMLHRPTKKLRMQTGLLGAGKEKLDATGLVPFYTEASQVPAHLQKYFSQRERYFSLYSSGCLLDEEGWYSVTPEAIADQIAERCRCDVVLDAFCGVGGNAIAFAKTCERVIALDISPVRLALARHNAALYGVEHRIEFILADFFSFARTLRQRGSRRIDVVFLSPPWGGPSYLSSSTSQVHDTAFLDDAPNAEETCASFGLDSIQPMHGAQLFKVARGITKNVAYFLPRNTNLDEISQLLVQEPGERVEVEEEWMGNKLKALTCYFGGLVSGQEGLFS